MKLENTFQLQCGILVSSKLMNYRLQQLENRVAKQNHFAKRLPFIEEQIKVINHRLEDLEHENQRTHT